MKIRSVWLGNRKTVRAIREVVIKGLTLMLWCYKRLLDGLFVVSGGWEFGLRIGIYYLHVVNQIRDIRVILDVRITFLIGNF